jgi:hypothetical protein
LWRAKGWNRKAVYLYGPDLASSGFFRRKADGVEGVQAGTRNGIRNRRNMIASENTNAVSVRSGESWQSPKNVENERIFGQIVFDALRQLIREEIDAALKRAGSTAATKNATRRE